MNLDSIHIVNFRCIEDKTISFNKPDGQNEGSGLNVLIGENGTGKTSVLEAISLLNQSRLKTKGTLGIKDFLDVDKEILIESITDLFDMDHVYGKTNFQCNGFTFKAKTRQQNTDSITTQTVFDTLVNPVNSGIKDYEIRVDVQKPWGTSRLPSLETVFFDKNRTRHLSKGMFSTKFEDVSDDLNHQVLSKIQSLNDVVPDEAKQKKKMLKADALIKKAFYDGITDKLLTQVNSDCKQFFEVEISLDILNNLEPYLYSFFSAVNQNSKYQLPISRLGSGPEMIVAIIFLYHYFLLHNTKLIILIDEPELHLHPMWQMKLIEYLLKISKDTQIFISTHSPYILKNCINTNASLNLFIRDTKGKLDIVDGRNSLIKHFPWSPSWGEINYFAYNMPTIEFHNELYGYLQSREQKFTESEIENYFQSKSVSINKSYIKQDRNGNTSPAYNISLPTYVRNLIHHPENRSNKSYSDKELNASIQILLGLL